MWDELHRKNRAKQPTSMVHLWKFLQEVWAEQSLIYLQSLMEKLLRICEAINNNSEKGSFWWIKSLRSFLRFLF